MIIKGSGNKFEIDTGSSNTNFIVSGYFSLNGNDIQLFKNALIQYLTLKKHSNYIPCIDLTKTNFISSSVFAVLPRILNEYNNSYDKLYIRYKSGDYVSTLSLLCSQEEKLTYIEVNKSD